MCGIFGFTGKKYPDVLERMQKALYHRGPDDKGTYTDSDLSMGMTRLSIIDRSGGKQPMFSNDGKKVVVFNGEIYNYIELTEELKTKGHSFKTHSDTETIVHAYEEYGLSFSHKLNGMFAIALWDSSQKKLILVRDRFGVKPLFYGIFGNHLVFGSEIKSILCYPGAESSLDEEALSHYLSFRHVPAPFTIYKNIRALLPGHRLIWHQNEIKIERWYDLPMKVTWKDEDEKVLVEKIDDLLRDSIRLRLRSDVKYGAYLSGGIDSSTVVAIMSELSPEPVETFCLTYQDAPEYKKDAHYARLIAEKYSTHHHEYVMDPEELTRDVETVIQHLDQPFAGVNSSFWLSRFIKQYVTVALSGDGADDTFGSYGHHRLVWPLRDLRLAKQGKKEMGQVDFGFFENKKKWVCGLADLEPWEWRLHYAAYTEEEKKQLLSPKGCECLGIYNSSHFLRNIYLQSSDKVDDLNRMLYLDIQTLLPNEILYYSDLLSMAHSLEVRTPYLDYRLVELANTIPGTLKIRGGVLKYILRQVAAKYLPQEILERPKEGFVLPKNTWLREGIQDFTQEVLSPERLKLHGYFRHEFIGGLIRRFEAGDDALTFKLWTLIVFQLWFEGYRAGLDADTACQLKGV